MDDGMDGLSIAEVAAKTGLSAHTLRYYERAGLLPPPPARGLDTGPTMPARSTGSGSSRVPSVSG